MKTYRETGAAGAILDEYEKALEELIQVIEPISHEALTFPVYPDSKDPNCISIQSVLTHVVRAGYRYIDALRILQGENLSYTNGIQLDSAEKYIAGLREMFKYNEQFFEDYPSVEMEENDNSKKVLSPWGQVYDVEQLMEHAIVHILRHRRQIERYLILIGK